MSALDPLAQLRDIHPPDPVSWWPPAAGWWLLGLAVVGLGWVSWWSWQARRRSVARAARAELSRIKAEAEGGRCPGEVVAEVSALLRRCALARFPAHEVAGLSGEAWLAFLDRSADTDRFSRGAGRALISAPYARSPELDPIEMLGVADEWIDRALRRPHRHLGGFSGNEAGDGGSARLHTERGAARLRMGRGGNARNGV